MMKSVTSVGDKNEAAKEVGEWYSFGFAFGFEEIQNEGNGSGDQFNQQLEQLFDDDLSVLTFEEARDIARDGRKAGRSTWIARNLFGMTSKKA